MNYPIPNLIVAASLAVLGTGLIVTYIAIISKGGAIIGKPSTDPWLFYTGKVSIFLSIGLLLTKALLPDFGGIEVASWLSWLGAGLTCLASWVILVAFHDLGASLKYGLPDESTLLKTNGLFRYSRNPLYVGIFLVNIASALYFPSIWNILISLYCIGTHIIFIRGEEKFLTVRFGQEWINYKTKVRRFL